MREAGTVAAVRQSASTGTLSVEAWRRRHAIVVLSALAVLAGAGGVGMLNQITSTQLGANVLAAALFLILAGSDRVKPELKALLATAGALVASTAFVVSAEGARPAHLVFLFVSVLVTVYRDLVAYALVSLYVLLLYALVLVAGEIAVLPQMGDADSARRWALLVVGTSFAVSATTMLSWWLDASGHRDREALQVALAEAALRERQAVQIHDQVVQGLAVAKYALESDDVAMAAGAIDTTLASARVLIGGLLAFEGGVVPDTLLRDGPAVLSTDAGSPSTTHGADGADSPEQPSPPREGA